MALTTVDQGLLGSNAQYTGFKNRIINGAMVIDQRNAGASVSTSSGTSAYTVDRWKTYFSQTGKYTIQQNAGLITPPAGFTKYLGVTSASAYSVLAGDIFVLQQLIEGFNVADLAWGTANAKTVTLSFQVYSSLTGTFGGSLTNSSINRSYPFSYTISSANTWTQISITIAGDTTGTWSTDNTAGIILSFGLGVGSTSSGTAGAWSGNGYFSATGAVSVVGTNTATFYITGVQLEKGSTATSFDYRPYGTELALCQRYYYKYSNTASGNATAIMNFANWTTASAYGTNYLPVSFRAAPTMSYSALSDFTYYTAGSTFTPTAISGPLTTGTSPTSCEMYINTGSSWTAGYSGWLRINAGSSGYLAFSAEL